MKTSELLSQAFAKIDAPEKWCKCCLVTMDGLQRCAIGALTPFRNARETIGNNNLSFWQQEEKKRVVHALYVALPEKYTNEIHSIVNFNDSHNSIVNFNDSHEWQDVRDLFLRAIEVEKMKEAAMEPVTKELEPV